MKESVKYILLVLLMFPLVLLAQDGEIEKLRKEMKQLEQEIEFTKKKITEIKGKKKSSLHSLVTLKKQLSSRKKLVRNIEQQIQTIENEISSKERIIASLNRDLERLKDEYAEMLYNTYINNNYYNNLLFVFSAGTFNDAYNRLKYLNTYADYRKKQAELIKETRANIEEEIAQQQILKEQKENLLQKEKLQQQLLASERKEVNQELEEFEDQEVYYRKQVQKKESEVKALEAKVERLIAEAMREEEKESAKAGGSYALTPEARELGENFETNKGKLPWPVEHGTITRQFGNRPHPVLPNQTVTSLGVGISTNEGETVRAIFDGTVVGVFYDPSNHRWVLVSHGTYFTVYLNMKSVDVVKGQGVNAKQRIGTVYTDADSGVSEVEIQIWRSSGTKPVKLNPALWLYR